MPRLLFDLAIVPDSVDFLVLPLFFFFLPLPFFLLLVEEVDESSCKFFLECVGIAVKKGGG